MWGGDVGICVAVSVVRGESHLAVAQAPSSSGENSVFRLKTWNVGRLAVTFGTALSCGLFQQSSALLPQSVEALPRATAQLVPVPIVT